MERKTEKGKASMCVARDGMHEGICEEKNTERTCITVSFKVLAFSFPTTSDFLQLQND